MEVYNATQFANRFPIGSVITIGEFDEWCINVGLVDDPETSDKESAEWQLLLKQRNWTRGDLNKISTGDSFPAEERFTTEVHSYGKSYIVKSVNDQFVASAKNLPQKVMKAFETKYSQLVKLADSTDVEKLPDAVRIQVKLLTKQSERTQRAIAFTLNEAQVEMEELFAEVREHALLVEGKTNGGFEAISVDPLEGSDLES